MSKTSLKFLLGLALIFLIIAFLSTFINLENIVVHDNDGYVAAFFSLTAVVLYFVALMYQKKEYTETQDKMQQSIAVQEKQGQILVDQNFTNLFFRLYSGFRQFKIDQTVLTMVTELKDELSKEFYLRYKELANQKKLEGEVLSKQFAKDTINHFEQRIFESKHFDLFRQYLIFVYNILTIIDKNKEKVSQDNYTSTFFVQLHPDENLLLSLASFNGFSLPGYHTVKWDYQATERLLNWINAYAEKPWDFYFDNQNHKINTAFEELQQGS